MSLALSLREVPAVCEYRLHHYADVQNASEFPISTVGYQFLYT